MSLKAFSYLLDYRHKEHRGLTCHSVYTSKGLDSGGEIVCGSSTNGGRSVGSVSLQEDIHRSGEKNNELLH